MLSHPRGRLSSRPRATPPLAASRLPFCSPQTVVPTQGEPPIVDQFRL